MAEDWATELPDDGRWALSRLELGTPAIHGGLVLGGSSRKTGLHLWDRASGRLLRVIPTEGPVQCPPVAVEGGWLVADALGGVLRLDAAWKSVWKAQVGGAVSRPPLVTADLVIVSTSADTIVALGLHDGVVKWTHRRPITRSSTDLAILGSPTPVLAGDRVLAGFSDGALEALTLDGGVALWSSQVGDGKFPDLQAEPLVIDDLVVVASYGGGTRGLDLATQEVRWRDPELGAVGPMALDALGVVTSDASGRLIAFDPATGTRTWTWERPDAQFGPPAIAGSTVFVGDVSGTLYGVDRYDGTLRWTWQPPDGTRIAGIAAQPLVVDRQLIVPTAGGRLVSLIGAASTGDDHRESPSSRPDRPLGW